MGEPALPRHLLHHYLIEVTAPFHAAVVRRVAAQATIPGATLVTSRLARLECRTRPLREANTALLARYEALLTAQRFRLAEISSAVIESATDLRARYGFKTPDAIHLATAIVEKADAFLTGDSQLRQCAEVRVELVP